MFNMYAPRPFFFSGTVPTASFLAKDEDASNLTEYTYTLSFGAAASNRYLIACATTRGSATSATVDTLTIGGVTATQVVEATVNNSGAYNGVAIYIAAVPTGTSGDVVVTYNNSQLRGGCGLYRVTGLSSSTAHDTASDNGASSPLSDTINVLAGGFVIGVATGEAATTWAGVTETYDEVTEGSLRHSGGLDSGLASETGRTVSATIASFPYCMAAASFR